MDKSADTSSETIKAKKLPIWVWVLISIVILASLYVLYNSYRPRGSTITLTQGQFRKEILELCREITKRK